MFTDWKNHKYENVYDDFIGFSVDGRFVPKLTKLFSIIGDDGSSRPVFAAINHARKRDWIPACPAFIVHTVYHYCVPLQYTITIIYIRRRDEEKLTPHATSTRKTNKKKRRRRIHVKTTIFLV